MSDCDVTVLDQFSCRECTTKTETRYDDSFCQIVTSNACDSCVDINPSVFNIPGDALYYTGEICMTDAYLQFCDNPDSHTGCSNFNPGCGSCCLPVNSKQNICWKSVPDDSLVCSLGSGGYGGTEDVIYKNSSVEGYSAFTLSVSVVSFVALCAGIVLLVLKKMSRIPFYSEFAFTAAVQITALIFVVLLIIQASLCASFYCSRLNEAALAFIVLSLVSLSLLVLEFKMQKLTYVISQLFPDGSIQVEQQKVEAEDPDKIPDKDAVATKEANADIAPAPLVPAYVPASKTEPTGSKVSDLEAPPDGSSGGAVLNPQETSQTASDESMEAVAVVVQQPTLPVQASGGGAGDALI